MFLSAVIVAGGSGSRLGSKKQFINLVGIPVLKRAVSCFDGYGEIDRLVIVVPEEDISYTSELLADTRTDYVITGGGRTRQESVMNGLHHVLDSQVVLIHDGVRPLVSQDLIYRVLKGLSWYEGCIPALEVTDTMKEASEGFVVKTIPRGNLFQVQTPQAFVTKTLVSAHEKAFQDGSLQFTDDSSLIEAVGKPVRIVQGDPLNVKITFQEDILLMETIIRCRTESE